MNTERYQTHCRRCFRLFEADSTEAAIRKAEEHERTQCDGKIAPPKPDRKKTGDER